MNRISWAAAAVALLSLRAVLGTVLTFDDALDRSRHHAPTVLAATDIDASSNEIFVKLDARAAILQ